MYSENLPYSSTKGKDGIRGGDFFKDARFVTEPHLGVFCRHFLNLVGHIRTFRLPVSRKYVNLLILLFRVVTVSFTVISHIIVLLVLLFFSKYSVT